MNRQSELFPETLLVDVIDGKPYTTSLKVAEHFHKNHKNVLRAIEELVPKAGNRLNFEPVKYQDAKGEMRKMYRMSRKEFSILVMGFTGEQALFWKLDFYDAFDLMEQCFAEMEKRWANAMRVQRPHWQTILDGTEAGESRTEIANKTGHRSLATITANRRRMRLVGLMGVRHG